MPTFLSFESGREEASGVAQQVRELLAQGRNPGDIAVLARYRAALDGVRTALESEGVRCTPAKGERRPREPAAPEVTLTTFHSSKGLEFPCVFLVGLDRIDEAQANRVEELRLLYVAMTRATHGLVLTAVGASRLTRDVQQALARVKAAGQ
jgi:superfamily I DNA/RNA helicase